MLFRTLSRRVRGLPFNTYLIGVNYRCAGGLREQCACAARARPRLSRALEAFYEKCAAFNLRYCPYWKLGGSKNSLENTIKDFVVIFCFFFTNFIVFLTLAARLARHVTGAVLESADWIQRSICDSKSENPRDIRFDY